MVGHMAETKKETDNGFQLFQNAVILHVLQYRIMCVDD
jgi:hypothetical protein